MTIREPIRASDLVDRVVGHGPLTAVEVTATTGSTNTDLVAAARQGAPAWTAHVTDHQVAGRGRHGRPWQAPQYSQVTLSVLVRPAPVVLDRLGLLPLAAGLAVVDAVRTTISELSKGKSAAGSLRDMTDEEITAYDKAAAAAAAAPKKPRPGDDCLVTGPARGVYAASALAADAGAFGKAGALIPMLKWPNDALIGGRKVCGILAEAASLGDDPAVVVGLGLNVSLTQAELPVSHATSLDIAAAENHLAAEFDRTRLCGEVLLALYGRLNQWQSGDPGLMGDYRRSCGTIGHKVTVHLPGDETLTGCATGITPDGRLVVQPADGNPVEVTAGDVTHLRQA